MCKIIVFSPGFSFGESVRVPEIASLEEPRSQEEHRGNEKSFKEPKRY